MLAAAVPLLVFAYCAGRFREHWLIDDMPVNCIVAFFALVAAFVTSDLIWREYLIAFAFGSAAITFSIIGVGQGAKGSGFVVMRVEKVSER